MSLTFDEKARFHDSLEAKSDSKKLDELFEKPQMWFINRDKNVIGVGRVIHNYPNDIGHGPEPALCQVEGRIENSLRKEEHWRGIVLRYDVFKNKQEAIRVLIAHLELEVKKLHEKTNIIHGEKARWAVILRNTLP